jgi:hypothetical protein
MTTNSRTPRSPTDPVGRSGMQVLAADNAHGPHAFVAIPFGPAFEDVFHFGIASPVRAAGLACERMDQVACTGDVIGLMKERIAAAALVIADLSSANANVYLEVGYAWGTGVPCILICDRRTDLPFDVRSQRCLFYDTIVELERRLSDELAELAPRD